MKNSQVPHSYSSNLSEEQENKIHQLIRYLEKYPEIPKRKVVIKALHTLIAYAKSMEVSDAVAQIKKEYPELKDINKNSRLAQLIVELKFTIRTLGAWNFPGGIR